MKDKREETLVSVLEHYAPRPGRRFYQRMAAAPWNRSEQTRVSTPFRRAAFGVAVCLVILVAFVFAIPTARAAFINFLGLHFSPSNTMPNPSIPAGSLIDSQKVAEISEKAGWTIKEPTWLPEGYRFSSAMYEPANKMVLLTFMAKRQLPGNDPNMTETKAITLIQALRNDIIPLMVAPSTDVRNITVNGQPAAYAVGAWENDAATGQATWRNTYPLQNVYWQIDTVYLNLNTNDSQVSQADLIRLADSVK